MSLVSLKLPPGVLRAKSPLLSKGRYFDSNLIRWRSGKLQPVGGWSKMNNSALASIVRALFPWTGASNNPYIGVGCNEHMYIATVDESTNTATYSDVTPTGFVGLSSGGGGAYGSYTYGSGEYGIDTDRPADVSYLDEFCWTFDNWGQDLLAVASSDGRLLHWGAGEDQAHPAAEADITSIVRVSNVATVTTDHASGAIVGNNVIISGNSVSAFNGTWEVTGVVAENQFTFDNSGTNTSGTGGTVTYATVPTQNRGVIVTPERHVVLIGAGSNERRVAWSSSETYTDWDFADPTNTAGYLDLDTQTKITMCATVREGTLIWTQDEAWILRYIGLPYIYSVERIGYGCGLLSSRSFATTAGRCIWMGKDGFWIYDAGTVRPLPSEVGAYVYGNMNASAAELVTHGAENSKFPEVWFWYPSTSNSQPSDYVVYSYAEGWWAIGKMTRTAAAPSVGYSYPIAADASNYLYNQEYGWTNNGSAITTQRYAESGAMNISDGNSVVHVRQTILDNGYGYDKTRLTFYSSFTPDGTETESGPYTPRSDGYTDTRLTGRDVRVRINGTEDSEWSIGDTRLEQSAGGMR